MESTEVLVVGCGPAAGNRGLVVQAEVPGTLLRAEVRAADGVMVGATAAGPA